MDKRDLLREEAVYTGRDGNVADWRRASCVFQA